MELGVFTEFGSRAGMRDATAFDGSRGRVKAAEDLGLDAGWTSVSAWVDGGRHMPHERVLRSRRRFAERVVASLG
jgi:hypothetical protein